MARRFGKFNPRQPRDRRGRWTKGAGSSSKPKAKSKPKTLSDKEYRGRAVSNAIGAAASFAIGQPVAGSIYAVGVATNTYRVGSSIAARRVASSKKLSAAQKRKFTTQRKRADAFVGKVEKAQVVALAGAMAYGFATQAAGLYNATKTAGPTTPYSLKALGAGGAGLKVKKPRRGVYNITTLKG